MNTNDNRNRSSAYAALPNAELRALLLELARREDELACDEAAGAPYWAPTPASVLAHRDAAQLLRLQADALLSVRAA